MTDKEKQYDAKEKFAGTTDEKTLSNAAKFLDKLKETKEMS